MVNWRHCSLRSLSDFDSPGSHASPTGGHEMRSWRHAPADRSGVLVGRPGENGSHLSTSGRLAAASLDVGVEEPAPPR